MKSIFLYAYDKQNLGDDLFIQYITGRYPDARFCLWSDKASRKTFADIPNLRVIDRDSALVRFLHKLRPSLAAQYKGMIESRCDAVVYIGGSIFIEYPNWEQICTWWEWMAQNRPFYVLGANFGPYHTEAYREKMAEVFKNCRDICFRDRYSYQLFREADTVRYAPDILFSCPIPLVPQKDNQVFISVIDCSVRDDLAVYARQYSENMAEFIRRLRKEGREIVLASFCRAEGDEDGIRKITDVLGQTDGIRVLCYDGTNRNEMLTAIAESGFVVGTRFHAVILALAAGKPVLPVIYSDKTKHVLEDIGFNGTVYDLRTNTERGYGNSINLKAINVKNKNYLNNSIYKSVILASKNHFSKLEATLRLK